MTKDEEQKSKCKKVFTASTPIRTRPCRVDLKIIKGLELTIKNYFINNPTKQLKKPKRVTFKEDLVSLRRIEDDTWNDALASPVEHMVATKEVKNDATVENVVEELFADCPTKSCNTKEYEKVIKFSKAVEINKACIFLNISTTKSDSRVNKTEKKNSKEKSFIHLIYPPYPPPFSAFRGFKGGGGWRIFLLQG